ncbi:hypothetical protein [Maridesulfovibrio sp.]|uniref:hypothetical protein n=1 Tax=Maridesulfovibrio sp. TaxID=2795000 RepID=UPI0029C9C268|nr:hypothetical protein [Maridesulfovibrio sp.]
MTGNSKNAIVYVLKITGEKTGVEFCVKKTQVFDSKNRTCPAYWAVGLGVPIVSD